MTRCIAASSYRIAAICCGIAACAHAPRYDYSHEPDPRRGPYVIGIGDGLKVTVWKNAELSGEARVRPDGTITLPLVGEVPAAGRTASQLHDDVAARLGAFIKAEGATLTIAVTDPQSYRVIVAGNVEHPGVFAPRYYLTVSEAIALAGGPSKFASDSVTVIRADPKAKARRVPIDYRRVKSGMHPEEDLGLFAGDSVVVE